MSPDRKHGRDASHRRAAQAAARAVAQRRQRRLRAGIAGVVAVVVVLAVVLATVPGGGGDDEAADAADTTTTTTTTTIATEFAYGTGECAPDTKPAERPDTFDAAPKQCLEDGVDYTATVETDHGTFTIDLLEDDAPGTVNNFVQLAKWGWFDGDDFHRVVPGFVNQAGDPVGDPPGTGDPGYSITDELPTAVADYVPGAVAMANAGPNTGGSQWFTCIDCSVLPTAGYSLFGQVTDGMDVVQAINDLGTGDGPPSEPVTITSITINEG